VRNDLQLGYQGVNAEPLTVNAARELAAALLAAANKAKEQEMHHG
jgi:hypothetical protein